MPLAATIKKLLFLFLILLYSVQLVNASEFITLNPDGEHSNQNQINKALEQGNVYLNPGVYEIDDNIILPPNRVLTGDSNAIVRVWGGSSKWFTGLKGVINCGNQVVHDVEISNFQIDGNIGNLPKDYANSRSDTSHDCQKLIILHGYSNQFASNITIRNMKLYNSFSDGVYILFADGVAVSNNFISNTQHEGVYLSCVNYGLMYGNKIAGICSDCGRLDNCQKCKVYENYFFSYNGESYGQFKGGQAGLQIANSGSSKGYNAANKPQYTEDVEVFHNVFADPGRQAIWLHNYDNKNIFIHDNEFKDAEGLETLGIPVGDISVDNPPTVEMSEKVFSSIFDILDTDFTDSGTTNQTADDISMQVPENKSGVIAGGVKIVGVKDRIVIDNVSYIPNESSILVKTNVIQNPDLTMWSGVITKIDKKVSINIKNHVATATLNVKTQWYTTKKDSMTGETKKSKIKSSTATFTDSYFPIPDILQRNQTAKARVTVFEDTGSPVTKVKVQHSNTTQRIEYTYEENTTIRTFLIGERNTGSNGVEYTTYSRCNIWEGAIPHMGDELIISGKFDPGKLHIKYYTPYESFDIKDVEIVYHKNKGENPIVATLKFIIEMFLAMYAGYKIITIVIE